MSKTVKQLVHVICVPFRIRPANGKKTVYLQETAELLQRSEWKRHSGDILPADVFSDANPDAEKLKKYQATWAALQKYQARAYFHPFVQRFLYDPARVRRFARDDIKFLQVDFAGNDKTQPLTLQVKRCELVLFQPDIGALLLEVSPSTPLSLSDTQRLMDSLRRLYPPYLDQVWDNGKPTNQWKSGHCPAEVRLLDKNHETVGKPGTYVGTSNPDIDVPPEFIEQYAKVLDTPAGGDTPLHFPWAAHWRTLLAPFNTAPDGQGKLSAHQFGDDRAPTMSYLAVDNPRDISEGDWMRLSFADAPGEDTFPYAKRFMSEFEQTYCYGRYWYSELSQESSEAPSRILNCGTSFSYVGQANDKDFFANETNGAPPIFRDIYVTMGLIAHFQRASLLAASERLTEMVRRNETGNKIIIPDRDEVRKFYDHFVEFTQNFWFDEISPQVQGQELFHMWRKHLRIQELYDEVHKELKDLVDYAELRATAELNQTVSYFGFAAIVLAVVSAVAGIFGMNPSDDWHLDKWTTVLPWWPQVLMRPAPSDISSISIPLLLLSALASIFAFYCLVLYVLRVVFKRLKTPVRNFLKGRP